MESLHALAFLQSLFDAFSLPNYTFTITLNPVEFGLVFIQILYVLYAFLVATKDKYSRGELTKLHMAFSVMPFLIGYPMDIAFSLTVVWFMYLDGFHFKPRTFSDKDWKGKIKEAFNYIGDLTFTYQSCYHYRPGEALNSWLARYRHKVAAWWAVVLNAWEKGHVH